MEAVETIIVGAGVVGLAIARALAMRGHEVVVLEAAEAIGTETSSRNSEVIHAGIYYAPGSLKARLCVKGRRQLVAYARDHNVPHRLSGKLIVATAREQEAALDTIVERAKVAGVCDLVRLSGAEAMAMEPALSCTAALLSPSTGIIDSHALMLALLGDAESHGAMLGLNTRVVSGRIASEDGACFVLETKDAASGERFTLAARHLVNAAGLGAQALALSLEGLHPSHVPPLFMARGSYFAVEGKPAFSRLVYPVPEPGGLGVHLTLDLQGNMRFGPDVEWIAHKDYHVNGARRTHFAREISRYWPALPEDALHATYCGIRPKLSGPGEPAADFAIHGSEVHGVDGLVNLFGIESPGLTASLAIAEEVALRLDERSP
ncbi:NAD(P)/FAD-dependent oxidoreductase [Mesorhizobium sp. RP14(2022)]|uniref:NAD(P)/FAD-dependent oxidoreductase n=1 Tax=Mesorhizobium liriopis TaxID=2953882 RepID=A0ABT1C4C5_9HYPH|nr:NAD(P)/FAD-dependent oxidoreductase [Mesorhizobium liriopis]MCO6049691.1 NAD(P)/FAD-dependent oxidoreductase [Mesorhizobium liriopis]